jgi:hypothetical protein
MRRVATGKLTCKILEIGENRPLQGLGSLFGVGIKCFPCELNRVRHGITTVLVSGTNPCKKIYKTRKTHPVGGRNLILGVPRRGVD